MLRFSRGRRPSLFHLLMFHLGPVILPASFNPCNTMNTNTNTFQASGAYCDSFTSCFEIEINPDGDAARVRFSYVRRDGSYKYSGSRWQRVKWSAAGDPFVTFRGRRLSLDLFERCY